MLEPSSPAVQSFLNWLIFKVNIFINFLFKFINLFITVLCKSKYLIHFVIGKTYSYPYLVMQDKIFENVCLILQGLSCFLVDFYTSYMVVRIWCNLFLFCKDMASFNFWHGELWRIFRCLAEPKTSLVISFILNQYIISNFF